MWLSDRGMTLTCSKIFAILLIATIFWVFVSMAFATWGKFRVRVCWSEGMGGKNQEKTMHLSIRSLAQVFLKFISVSSIPIVKILLNPSPFYFWLHVFHTLRFFHCILCYFLYFCTHNTWFSFDRRLEVSWLWVSCQ